MSNSNVTPISQAGSGWSLTGSSYDESNFYTGATDGKGHGESMRIKVPPTVYGQMQALVQGNDVPSYRTYADIVRDALIHRFRWIQDNLGVQTISAAIVLEQKQAHLDHITMQREQWNKYIGDLDATLTDLINNGEYEEAWWMIQDADELTDQEMSDPYVDRLNKVLDNHRARLDQQGRL